MAHAFPPPSWFATLDDRWPDWRRRVGGMALALLLEIGLLLLLLTLGTSLTEPEGGGEALTTVDFAPDAPEPDMPQPAAEEQRPSALPPVQAPRPDNPAPPVPTPVPIDAPQPAPAIPLPIN